jgi:hypothetical protein
MSGCIFIIFLQLALRIIILCDIALQDFIFFICIADIFGMLWDIAPLDIASCAMAGAAAAMAIASTEIMGIIRIVILLLASKYDVRGKRP